MAVSPAVMRPTADVGRRTYPAFSFARGEWSPAPRLRQGPALDPAPLLPPEWTGMYGDVLRRGACVPDVVDVCLLTRRTGLARSPGSPPLLVRR